MTISEDFTSRTGFQGDLVLCVRRQHGDGG
jgi:hypothetical protein